MAKKERIMFVCSNCGEEFMAWQGRCSNCGEWNSLKEFKVPAAAQSARSGYGGAGGAAPVPLSSVAAGAAPRRPTGFSEVDRVLGGGIVPGSVVLLGGDPGIGKSTLLLQLADRIGGPVLYVSGEESPEQIALRATRLGLKAEGITVLPATEIGAILGAIAAAPHSLAIIDSIQTTYDPAYPSTPGSVVQVRETALRIQQAAKAAGLPVVLVGHITKEGTIAGPRTLEHLVDVVLYLEGDAAHELRILRAAKNRFGDASETGMLAMREEGLVEITEPGSFLLAERSAVPGSVLTAVVEGTRPVLVEVQALTVPSVFGYPKRTASGFDLNRLNVLIAVLQKRAGLDLSNQDVFVNVVGGLKVRDPGVDAAVCAAMASSLLDVPLAQDACVFGEVGLGGELRSVQLQARREREVEQLGYKPVKTTKQLRELLKSLGLLRAG